MAEYVGHMEALRRQRIIERKHDALENLAKKQEALEKSRNLESRGGELASRAGTRASATRQGPNQTSSQTMRYRYVLPPKPEPLHQWYDLQNKHIHHEARALDRNGRKETKKEFWQRS